MKCATNYCSWKGAAIFVGVLQYLHGVFGVAAMGRIIFQDAVTMFWPTHTSNAHAVLDGSSAMAEHCINCTQFGFQGLPGMAVDVVVFLFHLTYLILGMVLMEGVELENYKKCETWLWLMTPFTIVQAFSFAIFIMQSVSKCLQLLFAEPIINLICLWIVYRYLIQSRTSLTTETRNENSNATTVAVEMTRSDQTSAAGRVYVDIDPPPSYEECISSEDASLVNNEISVSVV